ncbi:MAG: hypothetical protein Q9217_003391 [Psora testacea]
MHTISLCSALALLSLTCATSAYPQIRLQSKAEEPFTVTAAQLEAIMSTTKSCTANSHSGDECVTAHEAAPWINHSFQTYGITTAGEAAGLIATIGKESGDFLYARHHFGAPQVGQGTRNMQMPNFNIMYAQSIPAIKDQVAAANGDAGKTLEILVSYGDYDFGSAAWFLTTYCQQVRSGLASGGDDGWNAYVTCLGASPGDGRLDYWHRAVQALGAKTT